MPEPSQRSAQRRGPSIWSAWWTALGASLGALPLLLLPWRGLAQRSWAGVETLNLSWLLLFLLAGALPVLLCGTLADRLSRGPSAARWLRLLLLPLSLLALLPLPELARRLSGGDPGQLLLSWLGGAWLLLLMSTAPLAFLEWGLWRRQQQRQEEEAREEGVDPKSLARDAAQKSFSSDSKLS